ncbi:guanylate kinase [Denitrovibrio acetiphilus DSM 12809]|jgi:guanylate kinase|uniref:Guanylate kinase n=1 Tax=Denitrovibrio acetiphilus (strain DSM 12809 / NBRC 114555 / N2460) TaxID=522772 RepID=D4H8I0_DENA2|nr:guanylate kinase [Denitrovibrio acetiphilus]ADD68329.1 guanylate kinase [Denitrovibrio acetiphilus DSM 12809]
MRFNKGKLFVVSAPSGAGKTTLCNRLLGRFDTIGYSVSYTTRKPRHDETDTEDYYFVDETAFKGMIDRDEFLEWAQVHGNYYGTSRIRVEEILGTGRDVLLDIDPKGARQLREKLDYGIYIFITAPSMKDLRTRLVNRRTESEEIMKVRLDNAREEIRHIHEYDYIIVNSEINKATNELEAVYIAEHLKADTIETIEDIMEVD